MMKTVLTEMPAQEKELFIQDFTDKNVVEHMEDAMSPEMAQKVDEYFALFTEEQLFMYALGEGDHPVASEEVTKSIQEYVDSLPILD